MKSRFFFINHKIIFQPENLDIIYYLSSSFSLRNMDSFLFSRKKRYIKRKERKK